MKSLAIFVICTCMTLQAMETKETDKYFNARKMVLPVLDGFVTELKSSDTAIYVLIQALSVDQKSIDHSTIIIIDGETLNYKSLKFSGHTKNIECIGFEGELLLRGLQVMGS